MSEFAIAQDEDLTRFNTAAREINGIAATVGRLGVAGAEDVEALTAEQEEWYRQLAEARLNLPSREDLEARKMSAERELSRNLALQDVLFGPTTSSALTIDRLAIMFENIFGQPPSEDALAAEALKWFHDIREEATALEASIRRLGDAAVYMAEGEVKTTLIPAERQAAIEAEVREARRAALEEPAQHQAQVALVDRPKVVADVFINSNSPMTIKELAQVTRGRVDDSTKSIASRMAATAVTGEGELARELQARGYRLVRVEVENPNATAGGRGRKTLIAYVAAPLDSQDK